MPIVAQGGNASQFLAEVSGEIVETRIGDVAENRRFRDGR
jgi:hypothetical protein